jgi:DNA repair exonuclease SbcCD nuclease subunit
LRPLRIAHCSDIHLDTDYHGGQGNLALRDAYRGIFADLLARIRGHAPDVLALPGDLFDSNRASAGTVLWAAEQLAALPFPVVMIPGNHDCLEEGAVFGRFDFGGAPNVHFLGAPEGERRRLPGLALSVWGRGMVTHQPEFRPLAGLPAPEPERWNLALGHGIFVRERGDGYRSSPVRAEEIAASGYDYVALGHHHALLDVSRGETAAYYSGAPVPISPERKGTYLIVELASGSPARVTVHALE